VRLLVKLQRFPAARAVADSILALPPFAALDDSTQDRVDAALVSLAALTGHPRRIIATEGKHASDYPIRLASGAIRTLPPEVAADALRLETYTAFGTPRDSIFAISSRINTKLQALFPASEVANVRASVLRRSLSLAAPEIGPGAVAELGDSEDMFSQAMSALVRNDRQTARRIANSIEAVRSENAPSEITMDAVLEDAWLRWATGDAARAAQTLDRAFGGLSKAPPNIVGSSAPLSASLVRAMLLRARLATDLGDRTNALKWSGAATALWGGGDPEVRQILARASR
jgi:hypothetical protein